MREARESADGYFMLLDNPDFAALDDRLDHVAEQLSSDDLRVRWLRSHRDAFAID